MTTSRRTGRSRWKALLVAPLLVGAVGAGAATVSAVPDPPSAVEPTDEAERFFDSRPTGEKVPADTLFEVMVAGVGDVPEDAEAVILNVAAVEAEEAGFVSVLPAGTTPEGEAPETSNVNYDDSAAPAISNAAVVPIGDDGAIEVYTSTTAHILIDVLGFVPAGADYFPVEPARVFDTHPAGSEANVEYDVPVIAEGAPDTITFVLVNLTLVQTVDRGGFLTAWPKGSEQPETSNVNTFDADQTRAGLALVPIGDDGSITIAADVAGNLLVDVFGYIGDSGREGLDPAARVLDTRPDDRLAAGETRDVQVAGVLNVPETASFVLANVAAVEASDAGFISVWNADLDQPDASNLNYNAGGTIANLVLVPLSSDGQISVFTQSEIHLLVDVLAVL